MQRCAENKYLIANKCLRFVTLFSLSIPLELWVSREKVWRCDAKQYKNQTHPQTVMEINTYFFKEKLVFGITKVAIKAAFL
jgi:hypothetical protein